MIFSEQYPDDYKAFGQKLITSLDKKQNKLNEKIKELEADNVEGA